MKKGKIIEKNGKRYYVRYFGRKQYLYLMDEEKDSVSLNRSQNGRRGTRGFPPGRIPRRDAV